MRAVEWEEPEWDDTERGWMLALAEWEASRCPVCGGDPAECQSPDADPDNPYATWRYWPELPVVCHVGTAARKINSDPEDKRALIPQVVRRRRGEPAPRLNW